MLISTETDWLASTDPAAMLAHVQGSASPRKLRLFAVACCYQVWDKLTDERSRRAVEVASRYADGLVTEEELQGASRGAAAVLGAPGLSTCSTAYAAARACWCASSLRPDEVPGYSVAVSGTPEEAAAHAALLRCVFGNPWRPAPETPCSWSMDLRVCHVAQFIYNERRPADLPVLWDALEEAGCDDAGLLAHLRQVSVKCPACEGRKVSRCRRCGVVFICRHKYSSCDSPGCDGEEADDVSCPGCRGAGRVPAPHALPGCWVLELLLGKE